MLIRLVKKAREGFIIQCVKDPKCFEKRIPRHKILNFVNEGASYSLRVANNKLMAVEMVQDLLPFWKHSFLGSLKKN